MIKKKNHNQCKLLISGRELEELKRHAYDIPECPGLDKRIQAYQEGKPFSLTYDELGWLVAVLEVVLADPKGYPCIEHNPWKLDYIPKSDERYNICNLLYEKLNNEYERIWDSQKQKIDKNAR